MLQSSSPSALLTASLDAARSIISTRGRELLDRAIEQAEQARQSIRTMPGLWCYGDELVGCAGVAAIDPTKLLIRVSDLGLTGFAAAHWLQKRQRIEVELADFDNVLCTVTMSDPVHACARLIDALHALIKAQRQTPLTGRAPGPLPPLPALPTTALSLREASASPSRSLSLRQTAGQVCAEFVIPYPPGIPVLLPGEIIEPSAIDYLEALVSAGATISGAQDCRLRRVRVVSKHG